ncbi:hypothetical protein JOM56_010046 [Amanita muscaria]
MRHICGGGDRPRQTYPSHSSIRAELNASSLQVYELIGSRWVNKGTALCFGQISEDINEALLVARAERNYDEIILSTAIRAEDVYHRQQGTPVVHFPQSDFHIRHKRNDRVDRIGWGRLCSQLSRFNATV